jgi:hypothetical protein
LRFLLTDRIILGRHASIWGISSGDDNGHGNSYPLRWPMPGVETIHV